MSIDEKFECYAYSGVGAWVTYDNCLHCDMGMNGCPAYPYEDAIEQCLITPLGPKIEQLDLWGNPL
jgi:hypothetical protein